jgi:hypothetical protein
MINVRNLSYKNFVKLEILQLLRKKKNNLLETDGVDGRKTQDHDSFSMTN